MARPTQPSSTIGSQFPTFNSQSFLEVRVPASTANLGPGFDTMGLALTLYLTVRGRIGDGPTHRLTVSGNEADAVPLVPEDNLVCRVAQATAEACGVRLPSLDLDIVNDIPLAGGLGSSAAAIVAGVSLVEAVTGREFPPDEFLAHAMAFENHADNLAPARFGGFLTVCDRENGAPVVLRHDWPPELLPVVVRPDLVLDTNTMRAALPAAYSRADVVFQTQHALLVVEALRRRDFALLREAMRDRLHQPYRAAHVPGLEEILSLDHPGLVAAALSGAGPSILALATDNVESVAEAMQACVTRRGRASTAYFLRVDSEGRTVKGFV